jgi:hypothetical protein
MCNVADVTQTLTEKWHVFLVLKRRGLWVKKKEEVYVYGNIECNREINKVW